MALTPLSSPIRQLVSSYTGKFGSVHYYVKALLDRPSQPALECRKLFEVEEPLDVNTPDLMVSLPPIFVLLVSAECLRPGGSAASLSQQPLG